MAIINWTNYSWNRREFYILTASRKASISFRSLFHNAFADKYYVGDTCMEPMFWIVDHFTKILGPICVVSVLALKASMICIAYIIGLPYWWNKDLIITVIALLIGHWILVNVVFHYYKAYTTEPGNPPQGALIPEAVSICKKCIAPKPPRTHHCSICNICVLKMDHHCPWLNNCIGHFNHHYFFMFCSYVWIGIIFVMVFGIPLAWDHFVRDVNEVPEVPPTEDDISNNDEESLWHKSLYHYCIVYAALLSIAVFVVVGALLIWHSRLISKGETSIEGYINKKERERLKAEGKVYKNPYDYGLEKNWKFFLGIHSGKSWRTILFPSVYVPLGNGLQWHVYDSIKWNDGTKAKK